MNKKGMGLGMQVVVVGALLLIIFIAVATAFGFGFKNVFNQAKTLLGFPSGQLEELKKLHTETEQRRSTRDEAIKERCDLLVKAAEFIKNKQYDEALDKYLEYNKVYNEKVEGMLASCFRVNTPNHVKFRILNALREKFFNLILKQQTIPSYDSLTKLQGVITKPEYDFLSDLIKFAAYTKLDELDKAVIYDKITDYTEIYFCDGEETYVFSTYYSLVSDYLLIKRYKSNNNEIGVKQFCEDSNVLLKSMTDKINCVLKTYEYSDSANIVLQASDYQFLDIIYDDIKNNLCVLA